MKRGEISIGPLLKTNHALLKKEIVLRSQNRKQERVKKKPNLLTLQICDLKASQLVRRKNKLGILFQKA